eukprot:6177627-Prymnesium_polylepis.1
MSSIAKRIVIFGRYAWRGRVAHEIANSENNFRRDRNEQSSGACRRLYAKRCAPPRFLRRPTP